MLAFQLPVRIMHYVGMEYDWILQHAVLQRARSVSQVFLATCDVSPLFTRIRGLSHADHVLQVVCVMKHAPLEGGIRSPPIVQFE